MGPHIPVKVHYLYPHWSLPVKWACISTCVWVCPSTHVWVCPSTSVWVCPSTHVSLWPPNAHTYIVGTCNRCRCISVGGCLLSEHTHSHSHVHVHCFVTHLSFVFLDIPSEWKDCWQSKPMDPCPSSLPPCAISSSSYAPSVFLPLFLSFLLLLSDIHVPVCSSCRS